MMQIKMQCSSSSAFLTHSRWKIGIIGALLDDREKEAINFIKENCDKLYVLKYYPDSLIIELNDDKITVDDFDQAIKSFKEESVIIETTSLRVDEVLLFCKTIKQIGISSISLLYTEPKEYPRSQDIEVLNRRNFTLSTDYEQFVGIPGSMFILNDCLHTKAIFLVGYEGQRLEKALDQMDIKPENSYVLFGVPAFQPGWEMDAFANNVKIMRKKMISNNVLFGGAQNPLSVFKAIEEVYNACGYDEKLMIVPIGTKPHGIGAALFACKYDNERVGVIYDHPNKKRGRSKDVGTWHLFNVNFAVNS